MKKTISQKSHDTVPLKMKKIGLRILASLINLGKKYSMERILLIVKCTQVDLRLHNNDSTHYLTSYLSQFIFIGL
jgi:hypothetical protein